MFLLVTGASGAGKSTVRAAVEPELSPQVECVELAHLAPRPAAPTLRWRQQTVEAAVHRAVELQDAGRHLLLAGDPVPAIEVIAAPSARQLDRVAVCLLDVSAEAQAERLAGRHDDPALLVHHQAFAAWMRRQAGDPLHMTEVVSIDGWDEMRWERLQRVRGGWGMHTIDTTGLGRREVADRVLGWCRDALAGTSPALAVG